MDPPNSTVQHKLPWQLYNKDLWCFLMSQERVKNSKESSSEVLIMYNYKDYLHKGRAMFFSYISHF